MFNGSASLRDAAGQLIENVTKSVRRKEEINDAYIEKLYRDVAALYRLDQIHVSEETPTELGKLPVASGVFLTALAAAWLLIFAYVVVDFSKKKHAKKKKH